jgi:glycosyltransferase involved in cell wall biosynthesis
MDPVVSVVIPTHNRPNWLVRALTSVLEGEFDDFEVVVSNNGEPEHTRRLCRRVPDSRVRWIEQEHAPGSLDNFLAGLALARGRYIAMLHDDDWWSPRFLSVLVPPLDRYPNAVVAFADHYVTDEKGEVNTVVTEAEAERSGRAGLREGLHQPFFGLAARQSVALTACLFRRDSLAVSEVTPEVGSFYDVWMPYLLASTGGAAYFTRERIMYYRAHAASYTANSDPAGCLAAVECRQRMLKDPNLRPYEGRITKQLAGDHVQAGARLLRRGAREPARRHLLAAIRLRPAVKPLAGWAASWVAPTSLLARL